MIVLSPDDSLRAYAVAATGTRTRSTVARASGAPMVEVVSVVEPSTLDPVIVEESSRG